jgi:hypothetical protein
MASEGLQVADIAGAAVYEALADTVKDGKSELDKALEDSGASLLVGLLGSVGTGILSSIALKALSTLFGIEDANARINRAVSKLVVAHFVAATTQFSTALQLEPTVGLKETPSQKRHRLDRYRNGLNSFDLARAMATESELLVIDMSCGFICSRLPGAEIEAKIHLRRFISRGATVLREYEDQIRKLVDSHNNSYVKRAAVFGFLVAAQWHEAEMNNNLRDIWSLIHRGRALRSSIVLASCLSSQPLPAETTVGELWTVPYYHGFPTSIKSIGGTVYKPLQWKRVTST